MKWGIITFLFSHLIFGRESDGAIVLNEKARLINIKESTFFTNGHYDNNGLKNNLGVSESFSMGDTELSLRYGLSPLLELGGRTIVRTLSSQTATDIEKKTGMYSAGVFARYQFYGDGKSYYAFNVHFDNHLFKNTKYFLPNTPPTNQMVLGDDGMEYGADVLANYLYSDYKINLSLGYNAPNDYLSREIVYRGEVHRLFEKLDLSIGLEGIFSLRNDPYASDPATGPKLARGVTQLFNSTNREVTIGFLTLAYDFPLFILDLKGGLVLKGVSTDSGYVAGIGLSFATEGLSDKSKTIEKFKEYHVEGSVLKISPKGNLIKIDQGLSTDIQKGMVFDIYQTDYFGGNVLVATGSVVEIGVDWSAIKITKRYNEIEIKPGFSARAK